MGITFNPFTGNLDISGGGGPLLITDTFVVNSEVEMLALTVQRGDLAVRTDLSKTFILQGDDPTVLSNWVELATPPDAVTSVNTQVGDVVLGKADVGLGNVDNTSDLDKPISTATQDALDLKYDASNPANYVDAAGAAAAAPVQSVNTQVGDVVLGKADVGLGNVDNTADLDKPISTATQDALDLKYDASNPAGYIDVAGAPVQSVNYMNGDVLLNASDIPYINPYIDPNFTASATQDAIDQLYLKSDTATNVFDVTKEPTGFVDRTSSTLQFSDISREFSIVPTGASVTYYIHGIKYEAGGTKSVTIPNTSGEYFIYFGTDTNLHTLSAFSPTLFSEYAFVSIVYWNAETQSHTYLADERHGITMDAATHGYLHTIFGARFVSGHALQGFTIGSGGTNGDAQFTADSGTIRDEDIIFQSPQQGQIPILYRQGQYWRKKAADAYPLIYSGTAGYTGANGRIPFNEYTGGNWQLTEANNSAYVLVHFFATNDVENPIVGIQGTAQHTSISDARISANLEIASLSGLPFTEFVAIGSVIFQTAISFGNAVKAAVTPTDTGANYVDFRGTELYTPAGEATTHGLLSGLSSDDHLQYLLVSGTRAMTGDLNMGVHKISNVVDPSANQDAATKKYVDDSLIPYLKKDGSVSVEGSLLPNADGTIDLGSASLAYNELFANSLQLTSSGSVVADFKLESAFFTDGWNYNSNNRTILLSKNTLNGLTIGTQNSSSSTTQDIKIHTGKISSGANNSGDIQIGSGTSVIGTTGQVNIRSGSPTGVGNSGPVYLKSGNKDGLSGASGEVQIGSGYINSTFSTGDVTVSSGANSNKNTGALNLNTGVSTSGSSGVVSISSGAGPTSSGNISLTTGTSAGTRGKVVINASSLDMSSKNIINVLDPVSAQDAATKQYVDDSIAAIPPATDRVAKAGDTMTGDLTIDKSTGTVHLVSESSSAITETVPVFGGDDIYSTAQASSAFDVDVIYADGHTVNSSLYAGGMILSVTDTSTSMVGQISAGIDPTGIGTLEVYNVSNEKAVQLSEGQVSLFSNLSFNTPSIPTAPEHATTKQYVDKKFQYEIVFGETLSIGDSVYISSGTANGDTGRTLGQAYKLDVTNDNRFQFAGIVSVAATAGNTGTIITYGELSGFLSLTPGLPVFGNPASPGGVTQTAPTTPGQWIVNIGIAKTATSILLNSALAASAILISNNSQSLLNLINNVATSYSPSSTIDVILCNATSGSQTINLPTAVGYAGKVMDIKKTDSSPNSITVDASGTQTIDGSLTKTIITQYQSLRIVSDGTNWAII